MLGREHGRPPTSIASGPRRSLASATLYERYFGYPMRLEPRFSAAPLPFAPEIRWVERAAELAEVAAPPSWTTARVEAWLDWADSLPLDAPAGTPPTLALEVGIDPLLAGGPDRYARRLAAWGLA